MLGNFYGHFTANTMQPKRTTIRVYRRLTDAAAKGTSLDTIREWYCQQ